MTYKTTYLLPLYCLLFPHGVSLLAVRACISCGHNDHSSVSHSITRWCRLKTTQAIWLHFNNFWYAC